MVILVTPPPPNVAAFSKLAKIKCRFGCDSPIVGIFHTPDGCAVFKDTMRALCMQHANLIRTSGQVNCIIDFRAQRSSVMGPIARQRAPFAQQLNGHPSVPIQTNLKIMRVEGMHGLGDNLHQRAAIRNWLDQGIDVWLSTPWASVYHDLVPRGLHLMPRRDTLRVQAKNVTRELKLGRFTQEQAPGNARNIRVWYNYDEIRRIGSFFGAMMANCQCDVANADFSLPIDPEWMVKAWELIEKWKAKKPIMILRPLVSRNEWGGCNTRNPDYGAYERLYKSIKDRYFTISVADLVPNTEWLVGPTLHADACFHQGELEFETLAALMHLSALVYCSPGFALIMAQAVCTATVCVFGGHESSKWYQATAKYAPFLGIDPINPCDCFLNNHNCKKDIAVIHYEKMLRSFCDGIAQGDKGIIRDRSKPRQEASPVHEPGRGRDAGGLDRIGAP